MECLYHNSYIMLELAETMQTICVALEFWQIGFWSTIMLLQDWNHHYKKFSAVIMNSWIVTVYLSSPRKLICSKYHNFPFLFCMPWTCLLMSNSAGVSRKKQRTLTLPVHLVNAPSFFCVARVAHLLLWFFMCGFSYSMFCVVYVCFPCLVFIPGLHSFDYAITLVPLITL